MPDIRNQPGSGIFVRLGSRARPDQGRAGGPTARKGQRRNSMKSGLVRGFLSVGIWTLISRVSGFVRDILMAAWLGEARLIDNQIVALAR